jgi:hypothetical protein
MKFIGQLLGQHLQRYPLMELTDLYKLLHQAALGAGHAMRDPGQVREALRSECTTLDAGDGEPVVDPISPDGKLARVHLRSYLAAGHDIDALADAFLATPQNHPAAPGKLAKFCACLGDLVDSGALPFSRSAVSQYFDAVVAQGFPVVRHSHTYRSAYRPAYRVVAVPLLPLH